MKCSQCEPTVRTKAMLTWAIPVDIELLGPHLEAYIEFKPVMHQLRLCHRFGKGPENHLNKLPQEILEMVIEEAMKAHRATTAPYSKWSSLFFCYEQRCQPLDHFDDVELNKIKLYTVESLMNEGYFHITPNQLDDLVEERIHEEADFYDICHDRKSRWPDLIEQRRPGVQCSAHTPKKCLFEPLDQILATDFGLAAFISQQRITRSLKPFVTHWESVSSMYPVMTTLSYLTLPARTGIDDMWLEDGGEEFDEDIGYHAVSSMFDEIDPSSLQLTAAQKKRFFKAMRILGLKPFIRDCQLPSTQRNHENPLQNPIPHHGIGRFALYNKKFDASRTESTRRVKGNV
jgi:hypothetical protein